MNAPEFTLKVAALVIKQFEDGWRILVHGFEHDPSLPLRFPGGGVDAEESLEKALHRELLEEAGLHDVRLVRKLGVTRFYKSFSSRFVERHDFLLVAGSSAPKAWSHKVAGSGQDAGEVFTFRWIEHSEFYLIDIELQKYLDPSHLPELFPSIPASG